MTKFLPTTYYIPPTTCHFPTHHAPPTTYHALPTTYYLPLTRIEGGNNHEKTVENSQNLAHCAGYHSYRVGDQGIGIRASSEKNRRRQL
jgi:hypothetical protein